MTKPNAIVDRLEVMIGVDGGPRRLVEAIETTLASDFGLTAIAATERAERTLNFVSQLIIQRQERAETLGSFPALTLIGTANDVVVGSCHVLPDDEDIVASSKRNRVNSAALLDAIKNLDFNQFERFGSRVLDELGATKTRVTPQRGDQGIDFYGELDLGKLHDHPPPFLKLARDVKLNFAGQAKHYPNASIGPDVVRELVGAITLAKAGVFSAQNLDLFDDIKILTQTPVVMVLFTTGRLSSGAIKLSEEAGIIARSGDQIAVFLADKGVGMVQANGRSTFDQQSFTSWLAS